MTAQKLAGYLRPSQKVDGLGCSGNLSVGGLKEQILDNVDATGRDGGKQSSQGHLLMVGCVAGVVDNDVELAANLIHHREEIVRLRRVAAEYSAAGNRDVREIVEVETEDFAAREIVSPQLERRGVAPARLACVAQPVIVPAAVPKPHQANLEQADGTVAKRLEKLGVNPCVVMPAAAGAFVGAVTIGQRREQIGAGVELRRQESQPPGGTIRPWMEF